MNAEFGKGFSVDTLENMRKFYLVYQNRIFDNLLNMAAISTKKGERNM